MQAQRDFAVCKEKPVTVVAILDVWSILPDGYDKARTLVAYRRFLKRAFASP